MIPFRQESNHCFTAAFAVLFLCICSSRIDPCWGENDYETTNNIHSIPSTRAHRFPSVETRIKLYMSNWYVPPCPGDDGAFVKYSFEDEDTANSESESWPTLKVEAYENHPIINQTKRIMDNVQSIIDPDMLFFMDQETILNCGNYSYDEGFI